MPWARALVNIQLGAALTDYWNLSPLEVVALGKASRSEKTEGEEAAEEKDNQQQLAAVLNGMAGKNK
jgi:hypothetical protein